MQRTHPHTHSRMHNGGCSFVAVCMLTNLFDLKVHDFNNVCALICISTSYLVSG